MPRIELSRVWRFVVPPMLLLAQGATAADWPTYQHDNRRSGVTAERLAPPLEPAWVFRSPAPPAVGWGEPERSTAYGVVRQAKVRYDGSFPAVAVGGRVFFASSAEHTVYAVDAASGSILWRYHTEAPPRLAPSVAGDRVLFGADDGRVRCLAVEDGRLLWEHRAAPSDEVVVGQGRFMSLWPVRSGVAVADGTAYFAAGLFPAEGIRLVALRVEDGEPLWSPRDLSDGGQANLSPQGYMLLDDRRLVLPSGRVAPALFDRRTGGALRFDSSVAHHTLRVGNGGCYATLVGDVLYYGTQMLMAARLEPAKDRYGRPLDAAWSHCWPLGHSIVIAEGTAFVATDSRLMALPHDQWEPACRNEGAALWETYREHWVARYHDLAGRIAALPEDDPRRRQLEQTLRSSGIEQRVEGYDAKEAELFDRLKRDRAARWIVPCGLHEAMILAGDVIYVGGEGDDGAGRVAAFDARSGRRLWEAAVASTARALAAADGRLLVSTDRGDVYCFARPGAAGAAAPREVSPVEPAQEASGDDADGDADAAKLAESIVAATGAMRGYALLLGDDGSLALPLAARTELWIEVVQEDAEVAESARRRLARRGWLGSRVNVRAGSLDALPHPPMMAELVVCVDRLSGDRLDVDRLGGGRPASAIGEAARVLRPLGGVAVIGRSGEDAATRLAESEGYEVARAGPFAVLRRGRLPGSRPWSHQDAGPGNTASSDDASLRPPLEILWFGLPSAERMVDRHAGAPAPLCVEGRMFVLGNEVVMAHDAYNGRPLWQRELPGAYRDGATYDSGAMAATPEDLFVIVAPDRCLRLAAETGETRTTYELPRRDDGQSRRWGWLAWCEGRLLGSRGDSDRAFRSWPQPKHHTSECVFAIDPDSGRVLWQYEGEEIPNVAMAAGQGRVFLVDGRLTDAERRQALALPLGNEPVAPRTDPRTGAPLPPDLRAVVALDASSGRVLWRRPVDLSDCVVAPEAGQKGGEIQLIHARGVLLLCSAPWNGHFMKEWQAGKFSRRSIIALDAENGSVLWSGHKGYRSRPIVVGETIYAEPWAHDLRTGEPRMTSHPLTGRPQPWTLWRGYGACGGMRGSAGALLTQADGAASWDLRRDDGLRPFGGIKLTCSVNAIAADGVVLIPGGAADCVCPFLFQCSWGFHGESRRPRFARLHIEEPLVPVVRIALNLGAPGDVRDDDGTLWIHVPHWQHKWKWVSAAFFDDPAAGYYFDAEAVGREVAGDGASRGWLAGCGARGLRELTVPLRGADDAPAKYRVRLHFAEPDGAEPGQRRFDVFVQDRQVAEGFDPAARIDRPGGIATVEVRHVEVAERLRVRLEPTAEAALRLPVLCALEAILEE